ncbi:hypothetical protein BT69DRAFT_21262 [Atractiella rhizophila]|nr:hypothetical protein BT69DRAFT_21262 [Atractiella rhizophila]
MKKKRARRTRAKNKLGRRYGSRSSRPRGTSSMSEDAEEDESEDDVSEEEINIRNLGAWVTCKTCCIATHWGCLPQDLKKETKKEFGKDVMDTDHWVTIDECRYCRKDGGMCKVCKQPGVRHEVDIDGDVAMNDTKPGNVLFRCDKCLRPAHYRCLPLDPEKHHGDRIAYYQQNWLCDDCEQFSTKTDYILAWRYSDPHDPRNTKGWVRPNAKEDADVEYLVKFEEESFREVRWVPHAVMKAVHQGKLRHFLKDGSKISYHGHAWDDIPEDGEEVESDGKAGSPEEGVASLPPDPNAESKIPLLWKTIDRILDVRLRKTPDVGGEGTSVEATKNVSNDPAETCDRIKSVYVKWCDLDYSQCSWYSSIPQEGDKDYEVFKCAHERYLASRDVKIPQITQNQIDKLNKARSEDTFTQSAFTAQPQWLKGGKLMDFQLDGVNWMYHQWWTGKSGILADEMGLGKTIQVISFISILKNQENRQPFLVIVPNSTISNWIREFEKWAPDIRVVPYFGLEKSRRRIEQYELFPGSSNTRTLRAHVVVATYEAFVQNTKVFKKVQRWETLIVDEGQRLKAGDTSQATRELAQLPVGRRYLMTGTPVNNNVGELLNLLHFLDPDHWDDVEHLSKEYENLDQARIEKLRESLRPYLLRRTKETVLDLPPCTEIIIPMSISPLQKEIYKSLLSKNAALMEALTMKTNKSKSKVSKSSLNNLLMQLRKCLGHPYLVSPDIEPTNLSPEQEHLSLVEASSKLTLLHRLLPKLKQRGHRVLLFTQFKIVLDILETFMTEERITYLRLDGNTPQETRQKGIDLFNKPNSPIDVYMLSTRAGGVGINLTTADTVIIFDSDWNPHQDLQAIARAHRIGQKKPVKVFRLMIKNTCEEKIMQAGKRKLVLDHLIVQRINAVDDTADDVESILQFGAKALFEDKEGGEEVIQYSDEDIERLLDRSDAEAKSPRKSVANSSFAFARVWELKKDSLNDMEESTSAQDDIEATRGFWNNILKEQEEAQRKAETEAVLAGGKGKRKRTQRVRISLPTMVEGLKIP